MSKKGVKQRNYTKELDLIIDGLGDSIEELSDEEIKSEFIEMNVNPDSVPNHVREVIKCIDERLRDAT